MDATEEAQLIDPKHEAISGYSIKGRKSGVTLHYGFFEGGTLMNLGNEYLKVVLERFKSVKGLYPLIGRIY
jgi:hypothetical protein